MQPDGRRIICSLSITGTYETRLRMKIMRTKAICVQPGIRPVDIKTADQLNLPTPEVEYHHEAAHPTEHQQAMVQELFFKNYVNQRKKRR